jgi:Putative transposase
MMTSTVPASIRRFIRSHPRECYRALLVSAKHAIVTLAKNPKYLGSANVGITGVLHTWGRTLSYHPHTHWIVPGGAISQDGDEWLPSRTDFFVPVHAASEIYRAKFAEEMKRCGLLAKIPAKAWKQRWNVNCKAVGDGRSALGYLAPYVFRVAIGNRRIVKVEPGPDGKGLVIFAYRKTGSNRLRAMTVSAEEFIRRFLQHVLPRGFQKVRHYGFSHPRSKTNWEQLSMLVTVTLNLVYVLTVQAKPERPRSKLSCPDCGGELRFFDRTPSEQERQRATIGGITSEFAKDFEAFHGTPNSS